MRSISIDGRSMAVRKNLYSFLWNFLSRKYADGGFNEPVLLWIDAICIDQTKSEERNHQVSQMRLVYENASEVVAWLGESDLDSERAFFQAQELSGYAPEQIKKVSAANIYQLSRRERGSSIRDSYRQRFDASSSLLKLASRSYWERIWIVQEILVSKDCQILCGMNMIPWKAWAIALQTASFEDVDYFQRASFTYNPASFIVEQWFARQQDPEAVSIFNLVHKFRDSRASDIHDKVYALLGIAGDGDQIRVNYDAPVSHTLLQVLASSVWAFGDEELVDLCKVLEVSTSNLYAAVDPISRLRSLTNTTSKDSQLSPDQYDDLVEYLRTVGSIQMQNMRETRQEELVEWSKLGRVRYCDCRLCKHQWARTQTSSRRNDSLVVKTLVRSVARPAGRRGGATVRTRSPLVVVCSCDNPEDRAGARQRYFASGVFLPYSLLSGGSECEYSDQATDTDKEVDYFLLLYHDPQMQESDREHPERLFNPWIKRSNPTGISLEASSLASQEFDDLLLLDTEDDSDPQSDLAWPEAYSVTQSLLFYAHAVDYTASAPSPTNARSPLGPQTSNIEDLPKVILSIDPATSYRRPLSDNAALSASASSQPLARSRRYAFLGFPADGKAALVRDYQKFFVEVESMRDWFSTLAESERTAIFFTLLQQQKQQQETQAAGAVGRSHAATSTTKTASATHNEHFSEDVGAVEQWFKLLALDERSAVLRAFTEQAGDVQQRFFARALA